MKKLHILFVCFCITIMADNNTTNKLDIPKKEIKMKFTYSEQWRDELLKHASNEGITRDETGKFIDLILMADDTNDEKVIYALIQTLVISKCDLGGVEETVLSTLASTDYKAYYNVLFRDIPKILKSEDKGLAVLLLDRGYNGHTFTSKEWSVIENLANKYLSKDILVVLLQLMENNRYFDLEDEDYPFPQFYKLFQKLLKEKSEQ